MTGDMHSGSAWVDGRSMQRCTLAEKSYLVVTLTLAVISLPSESFDLNCTSATLCAVLELVGGNSSSSDALPTSLITSFRCRNTLSNISNSIAISLATRRSNGNLTIEAENEASVGCQTREKPDLVTCFWERSALNVVTFLLP
ncbi:hypothetical protein WR25_18210 [Diploscapter pachys]|uniref:Uncharacterized protein n=1 Tax=Diploscapter pachys TaxID=2018661 RepID=A0A2A2L5W4_9BILA|nr:hypothetical protein WR25_18210 [Diploscapter pachys]